MKIGILRLRRASAFQHLTGLVEKAGHGAIILRGDFRGAMRFATSRGATTENERFMAARLLDKLTQEGETGRFSRRQIARLQRARARETFPNTQVLLDNSLARLVPPQITSSSDLHL